MVKKVSLHDFNPQNQIYLRVCVSISNDIIFSVISTSGGHKILLGRAFCFIFAADYRDNSLFFILSFLCLYKKKNFFFQASLKFHHVAPFKKNAVTNSGLIDI